jgi:Protein of unknown function (DUF1592)/Protein of unknown function (DUF1588)/Protein of unknown function (DUF1595)/Protein of unknown function (DUF1587)/Protein of unknown function (DUF1585)
MSERDRVRGVRGAAHHLGWLAVAAIVASAGCAARGRSGGGGGPGTGSGGTGVGGTAGVTGAGGGVVPGVFGPAPAGLRRLTSVQYRNTIADLFGGTVAVSTDLEADTALSGFASIGASLVSLSPHLIEQLETAALDVAHQALSNTATRAAFVGCNPTAATDDACTSAFLGKLGRRAWRRPLAADEVATLAALTKTIQTSMNSYFGGLEYGVAAILESPHFIYREELGTADPANAARVVFDDHELATRLSYFLWNTTPDDMLLDAADAKQLAGAGFAAQVQRLLTSPRAVTGAETFFGEYFRLGDLDNLPQLPSVFPKSTPTIGPAMREETQRFLADLAITRNGDFRDMFVSTTTFVNAELAGLYGLPAPAGTGFSQVTLPDAGLRAGYLGQGSFLALNAHSNVTSPTYRGKFIREMLMCETIPPPPMNVPPLPADVPGAAPQTMRQKLSMHRAVEPCKTCHTLMDPLGLAFENFDGIGASRTMDAGQVIDASGDLDGTAFAGPRDLEKLLSQNPATMSCVARNMYRYVTGHIESAGEEPAIVQLAQAFSTGQFHFSALISAMLASPAFTTAAPPSNAAVATTGAAGADGGAAGASGAAGTTGAGGSAPVDAGSVPTGPLSFATNIAPIIADKCSPCHTTQAASGSNWTYATLVTNPAVTNTATKGCVFLLAPPKRVVPGDPDHSLLYVKVTEDAHQAMANNCGLPMPNPTSGKTLTTTEIDTIYAWIKGGALP